MRTLFIVLTIIVSTDVAHADAVVYHDETFRLASKDGKFELSPSVKSQFRLEMTREDEDGANYKTRFSVPRLRLQLEGKAWSEYRYKTEFELSDEGASSLKDFYVESGTEECSFRVGQFKRPFSRHELIDDFVGTFTERSIANEFVAAGRDLGVMIHGKGPLEWAAGVFNGAGKADRPTQSLEGSTITPPNNVPDDWGPVLAARVGLNVGGIEDYSEGDFEDILGVAFGLSYQANLNNAIEDETGDSVVDQAAEFDVITKFYGVDAQGAIYWFKPHEIGVSDTDLAYLAQFSIFLLPKVIQAALRYSYLPTEGDTNMQEFISAVNLYGAGHYLKWSTDAGIIRNSVDEKNNLQVRTQVQAVF